VAVNSGYFLGVWYLRWPDHDWCLVAAKAADGTVYATSKLRNFATGLEQAQRLDGWPAEADLASIGRLRLTVADIVGRFLMASGVGLASPGVLLDEAIICGDADKCRRLLKKKSWVIDDTPARWEAAN
jgi:hypothetical protein